MEKDKLREYVVAASVREANTKDYEELDESPIVRNFRLAAGPIGADGKPRMLLLSAWIVHEGRNENGIAFVKEELRQRVSEGLFAPPHAGMIDFDHDFQPVGFWFKTSFAFDDIAGLWGILATGAIWAWRFPELTDALLAEQQRSGTVPVSMSELPESTELTEKFPGAEGMVTEIQHNPTFFTTSILDIPPGDIHARATVSEDASQEPPVPASRTSQFYFQAASAEPQFDTSKEETFMEDAKVLINEMRQERDQARESLAKAEAEKNQFKADLDTVKDELDKTKTQIDELVSKNKELASKVSEFEVALKSANETKDELETTLAETSEKLNEFETKEADAEKDRVLAERIAGLPEVVQKNIEEHSEAEALKSAWRELSEEQWDTTRNTLSLAARTDESDTDYVERSTKEGKLPFGKSEVKGSKLSKFIL